MSITLSIQEFEALAVSKELRDLVSCAYAQQGKVVVIPAEIVKDSCADLSSQTATEIQTIRRRERTVSSQTLAFSFA